jgi:hypothetical protein
MTRSEGVEKRRGREAKGSRSEGVEDSRGQVEKDRGLETEDRSQKSGDRRFGRLAKHLHIYTSKHLKQYMQLQCRNIEI